MRTGTILKLICAAAVFTAASSAHAHIVNGDPTHTASHGAPLAGLAALVLLLGAAAYRCFRVK